MNLCGSVIGAVRQLRRLCNLPLERRSSAAAGGVRVGVAPQAFHIQLAGPILVSRPSVYPHLDRLTPLSTSPQGGGYTEPKVS
jgi:hypothetical protein